jgi:hypothetical protein
LVLFGLVMFVDICLNLFIFIHMCWYLLISVYIYWHWFDICWYVLIFVDINIPVVPESTGSYSEGAGSLFRTFFFILSFFTAARSHRKLCGSRPEDNLKWNNYKRKNIGKVM